MQGGERASPHRCRRRPAGGGLVTAAASAAAADLAVFAGRCAAILYDSILICTGLVEPRRERARAGGVGGGQASARGWGQREVGRPREPERRDGERRRHPAVVFDLQPPPAGTQPGPLPSPSATSSGGGGRRELAAAAARRG